MIAIGHHHLSIFNPDYDPDHDHDRDPTQIGYQWSGTVEDQLVMRACHETLWGVSAEKNPVGSKGRRAKMHNRVRFALQSTSSVHIPGKELHWSEPTKDLLSLRKRAIITWIAWPGAIITVLSTLKDPATRGGKQRKGNAL
jgi:hypothetical protein